MTPTQARAFLAVPIEGSLIILVCRRISRLENAPAVKREAEEDSASRLEPLVLFLLASPARFSLT